MPTSRVNSAIVSPTRTGIVLNFTDQSGNPSNLTALSTNPTLTSQSINGGSPLALTNPIWGPAGSSGQPWLYYPLLTGAIGATDTPTLTVASGWATTVAGSVDPMSAKAVDNTAKTTLLPSFVEGPKTMPVGYNVGPSPTYYLSVPIYANLARDIQGWYGTTYTTNQYGYPTSIAAGTTLTAIVSIVVNDGTGSTKGIDNLPSSGTWTVLWDGAGTNGGGQSLLFLSSGGQTGESVTETSRNLTGTVDNKIQYSITQDQTYYYSPSIYIHARGAPFSNLRIYPPGVAIDGSQKFHPEYLKKIAGTKCLRFMTTIDSSEGSCVVDYSDYTPVQMLGYTMPSRGAGGFVTRVDPYPDTENYFGGSSSVLLTFSAPHGYKDGTFVSPNIPGPNADGSFPLANGQTGFLMPNPLSGGMKVMGRLQANSNQIAIQLVPGSGGKTTITTTYTAPSPHPTDGTWATSDAYYPGLPPSEAADLCNAIGADLWFNVSYGATDACVTQLFTMLAQRLAGSCKFYVEYSNECWNSYYPGYIYCDSNSRVEGIGHYDFYAKRAYQIHDVAEAALSSYGRGGDLVRVFGAQGVWAGNSTQLIVSYAYANNIPIDAIAVAPYIDNSTSPFVSGTNVTSDATYDLLSSDQLMDIGDQYIRYGKYEHYISDHYAVLASYYPNAKVVCYEGGLGYGLPGTDLAWRSPSWVVRQHIWARHPRMRWIMLYYLQLLQDQRCALFNDFQVTGAYEFSQGYNWNCYYTWDMKTGMGDGSDGLADNRINYEDYNNLVSVVGGAINHWNALASSGVDSTFVHNGGLFNRPYQFTPNSGFTFLSNGRVFNSY